VPAFPGQQIAAKPTILLCPHFVCLDVAGAATAMEISASSMYVQQKNAAFDQALRAGRSRFKPPKLFRARTASRRFCAPCATAALLHAAGHGFRREGCGIRALLRRAAATLTATARLAAAKAQVIPVIATFLPNYEGWQVTYYPAWDDYPGDDITAATRRMNEFIEERVREAPAEYFWTHKRFKTRPEGEASFYNQHKYGRP
jgi:KDO2-lipid IV(A) lauroyltransferase